MKDKLTLLIPCTISAVLLSIPWLVPHTGALALVGFVPLLIADRLAIQGKVRKFWLYYLYTFILWNALTTFWVCNATAGGGIFAIVANALQMSLVWAIFRFSKKHFNSALPYLLLIVMWIAWERQYFAAEISWPWLTLGNAFALSTKTIQWYEFTGSLGGSLWILLSNIAIYGIITALSTGSWKDWTPAARVSSVLGITLLIAGPVVLSKTIYDNYEEKSESSLEVIVAQPNFDPYQKFESLSQAQQTERLLSLFERELVADSSKHTPVLLLAPETFTSDVIVNNLESSLTLQSARKLLKEYPRAQMIVGASTYEFFNTRSAPSVLARKSGDSWYLSHNSAILLDADSKAEILHKNKLVVATEMTPYPKIFVPLDNWLSGLFGLSGMMGRCVGQDGVSVLNFSDEQQLACAICYESVYGEYCTEYVNAGAKALTVITNDAWWGNTPGYRQHLSYSCLRAIELRRDIARCGNTGISAFINQKGDIVQSSPWWEEASLKGEIKLNSEKTFFAENGDIVGRICTFLFILMAAMLLVRAIVPKR